MRCDEKACRLWRIGSRCWLAAGFIVAAASDGAHAGDRRPKPRGTVSRAHAEGKGLFEKIWEPGKPSEHGGDGLGPLYNADSCVACHHQGGVGGGGANDRNVTLLTVTPLQPSSFACGKTFQGEPEGLHPGLKNHTSVVIHSQAVGPDERNTLRWIRDVNAIQTRDELLLLAQTHRSTPALFGAGLIDQIPDDVLVAAEKRRFPGFPEISGRASRLKDGRLGRFGWKGQTASLRDFVLAACSNELGLEVPGRHQVSLAAAADYDPSKLKLDLDANECNLLIEFVREIPRPSFRPIDPIAPYRGREVFEAIGCATCHSPRLGAVDGLYSDLLLHDLGDRFRDSGSGYGSASSGLVVDRSTSKTKGDDKDKPAPTGEATPTEWRTAPLWGVAASPPYLHDGRARTLDEAIRLHGGEAAETTTRYDRLPFAERQALLSLLHSLRAPQQPDRKVDPAMLTARGRPE
jgi:CxxC motif-containing protein (DUF1111 family)